MAKKVFQVSLRDNDTGKKGTLFTAADDIWFVIKACNGMNEGELIGVHEMYSLDTLYPDDPGMDPMLYDGEEEVEDDNDLH